MWGEGLAHHSCQNGKKMSEMVLGACHVINANAGTWCCAPAGSAGTPLAPGSPRQSQLSATSGVFWVLSLMGFWIGICHLSALCQCSDWSQYGDWIPGHLSTHWANGCNKIPLNFLSNNQTKNVLENSTLLAKLFLFGSINPLQWHVFLHVCYCIPGTFSILCLHNHFPI